MSTMIQWIDIDRIHVHDRVRQNYSHLSDVMAVLREKEELEIPVLVAARHCKKSQCTHYNICGSKHISNPCLKGHYRLGFCLRKPLLIDGATRLEAARRLKWHKINCFVVEPKHESWIREVEIITNTMRKPFDLWEQVKAGLMLEQMESRKARKRLKAGKTIPASQCGRVRDLVAKKAGFASANSYLAAKQVYTKAQKSIKNLVENGLFKVTQAAKFALLQPDMQDHVAYIGSYIVRHSLSCPRLISFLARKLAPEDAPALRSVVNVLRNKPALSKQKFEKVIYNALSDKKQHNPTIKSKPDSLRTPLENLVETLIDCTMESSRFASLDEQQAVTVDKILRTAEKISRNSRSQLRVDHTAFADSYTDQVRHYYSMFREAVQFFDHQFTRKQQFVDDTLMDELHRTFHNSVTILHKAAALIARQLR